jgi:hypothetical protein
MIALLSLVQNPIIVDVGKQPDPTGDISIDFVVGMFAMSHRRRRRRFHQTPAGGQR